MHADHRKRIQTGRTAPRGVPEKLLSARQRSDSRSCCSFPLASLPGRAALRRAGIENFRFHDLRHTWASWLVQSGVPLSALQEMGGWESIEMVQRYAHLAPNHLTQHAMQIDSFLAGNGTNMAQGSFAELVNIA